MTDDIGKILTCRGISRHGKGRIATHGEQWLVMRDDMRFRGEPAWLVQSMDTTDRGEFHSRWIHKQNDTDFEVIT
jgi:hypothetical protein